MGKSVKQGGFRFRKFKVTEQSSSLILIIKTLQLAVIPRYILSALTGRICKDCQIGKSIYNCILKIHFLSI